MFNKLSRFSYQQLLVLSQFLSHVEKVVTINQLAKMTGIRGKSLGGVLSSLARTKYRQEALVLPMGKDRSGVGLRWMLNAKVIQVSEAKNRVNQLLNSFK